jgi:hypothetical protein
VIAQRSVGQAFATCLRFKHLIPKLKRIEYMLSIRRDATTEWREDERSQTRSHGDLASRLDRMLLTTGVYC